MTPEQENTLAGLALDYGYGAAEGDYPSAKPVIAYVASLLAQARAEERERAEFLRLALVEIAGSKSLTATPTQFYQYLQRLAADKLNADAESEIAPGVFSATIRARKDGQ